MNIIFALFLVQGIVKTRYCINIYLDFFPENLENYIKLISSWKGCILVVDMSNENENNFCTISGPGGLLKLDIIVCKANVLTYIWGFSEDWENYRKLIL